MTNLLMGHQKKSIISTMPKTTTYKLSIKSANEIGYTLQSIVAEPRQCNPLDLQAACANLLLVAEGEEPPQLAIQLVHFLLTDFFALSHRTGLYNRQRKLWDALARLGEVKISRLNYGIFGKTDLPILELLFIDGLGKVLLLARLFEPIETDAFKLENEKDCKNLLQSAVQRSEKLRSENPGFAGLFLCWPAPIANSVVKAVEQLTGASDPIARYESLIPGPFGVCINLLEFSQSEFALVHPKLPERVKTQSPGNG
jgi:hypothetical protein